MADHVLRPKEAEQDPFMAEKPAQEFADLEQGLSDAAHAEGKDEVAEAVAEVETGQARPEALLEWIDDLREAEERHDQGDDNLERSFTADFVPDTARDNAATETPPADDYLFSAVRRARDDDDGGDGGGGGGGGGDGDGDEGTGDAGDPEKPGAKGTPAEAKPAKPADAKKSGAKKSDKNGDAKAPSSAKKSDKPDT